MSYQVDKTYNILESKSTVPKELKAATFDNFRTSIVYLYLNKMSNSKQRIHKKRLGLT